MKLIKLFNLRNIYLLLIFFLNQPLYAQSKTFTILDETNQNPIPYTTVYYINTNEGSVSNFDGEVKINLIDNDSLVISHISYEELIIPVQKIQESSTIFLSPKLYQLNEVSVLSFDIEGTIQNTLEQYAEIYHNSEMVRECTYKEYLKVNKQYRRLIQMQLEWWSESYKLPKNLDKLSTFNKLYVNQVEYSKSQSTTDELTTHTSLYTHDIVQYFYLNGLLNSILNYSDFRILAFEESQEDDKILFEATKESGQQLQGNITLDKENQGISYLELIRGLNIPDQKLYLSADDTEATFRVNKIKVSLSFEKNKIDKLVVKQYEIEVAGHLIIQEQTLDLQFGSSLFITKEKERKKGRGKKVYLQKFIYQNLPEKTISNRNSVLLSKEELSFIND